MLPLAISFAADDFFFVSPPYDFAGRLFIIDIIFHTAAMLRYRRRCLTLIFT